MAVQTVTRDDLVEKINATPKVSADLPTREAIIDAAIAAEAARKPPEPEKEEEVKPDEPEKTDEPKGDAKPDRKKPVTPLQLRINELTREKKELEEFAHGEYEARMTLQRRINELETQQKAPKPEQPKAEEPKEPNVADFPNTPEGAVDFAKALAQHEVKKALRERDDAEAKRVKEAQDAENAKAMERANEVLATRTAKAREAIADFDEVIQAADRRKDVVPAHVVAAIQESEVGPQIAYHLAKNRDVAKRIFGLSPARALLELGRIELEYAKGDTPAPAPEVTPLTTRAAPAPMPSLNSSAGETVKTDFSKPMPFKEYKAKKLAEKRANRR